MSNFAVSRVVKARVPHRCAWLSCQIAAGERYVYSVGMIDGTFSYYHYCIGCAGQWPWGVRAIEAWGKPVRGEGR